MTDNPTPADRPGSNIPAVNVYAAYASTNNSVAADPRMGQLPVKNQQMKKFLSMWLLGQLSLSCLLCWSTLCLSVAEMMSFMMRPLVTNHTLLVLYRPNEN